MKSVYGGAELLGLNDALVSGTAAIAGFTIALQSASLIVLVVMISAISGALSMASAEYLECKSEETLKSPGKSALLTGGVFIGASVALIAPSYSRIILTSR